MKLYSEIIINSDILFKIFTHIKSSDCKLGRCRKYEHRCLCFLRPLSVSSLQPTHFRTSPSLSVPDLCMGNTKPVEIGVGTQTSATANSLVVFESHVAQMSYKHRFVLSCWTKTIWIWQQNLYYRHDTHQRSFSTSLALPLVNKNVLTLSHQLCWHSVVSQPLWIFSYPSQYSTWQNSEQCDYIQLHWFTSCIYWAAHRTRLWCGRCIMSHPAPLAPHVAIHLISICCTLVKSRERAGEKI